MQMNRRAFLVTGAALAIVPTSLALEGCTVDLKALLNTVLDSAVAVLKVAGTTVPGLQEAIAALQAAEASWTSGSPGAVVIDALNTLSDILAVIPTTAVYAPLVAILVAGIEAVLAAFGVTATPAAKAIMNPYHGAAQLNKPHAFQTYQGAYKAQWNTTAAGLGLSAALI